jgi:hypothetical protein
MVTMVMKPCDLQNSEVYRLAAPNGPNTVGLLFVTNGESRTSF